MKTYILITERTQYHISAKNLLDLYRKIQKLKLYDNQIISIDDSMSSYQWSDFKSHANRNNVQAVQVL